MLYKICYLVLLTSNFVSGSSMQYNRQLFRENLLPQLGGKIPESAFSKDRLTLNSFNENGIYTIDGKHVEQRPMTYKNKHFRCNTFKINLPPNNYIVTPHGKKNYIGRTVNTNYLIRDPVHFNLMPVLLFKEFPPSPVLSLSLINAELRNRRQRDYMWNEISPEEILRQMPPYIRSFLHRDD